MRLMLSEGMMVLFILSVAPLLCIGLVSLIISVIQAATQIQEQTMPYLCKIGVLAILLFLFGDFALAYTVQFTQRVLLALVHIV